MKKQKKKAKGDGNEDTEEKDKEEKRKRPDVSQRIKQNKTQRITIVKCCLKGNIEDADRTLGFIDDLVVCVSRCARYGSLLFNAILLEQLEQNKGQLPDNLDFSVGTKLANLIRHCFTNNHKDPLVKNMFKAHPGIFDQMVPERLKGDGQAVTFASNQYIVNFKNHVNEVLDARVKQLLKSFINQNNIKLAKGERWTAQRRIMGTSVAAFHDTTPEAFVDFVDRWAEAFSEADDLKKRLEFTYQVLLAIKSFGGKMFSIAPIVSNRRHYVTIDKDVVWSYFYNNCYKREGLIDKKMTEDAFDAIPYTDHLFTLFKSKISRLKNPAKGWRFTGTLKTDGYGLVVHFMNMSEKAPKAPKRDAMVYQRSPEDHVVAFDPGRTNILYGISDDEQKYKLSRYEYYKQGGLTASLKMHNRWNLDVKDVLEALSQSTTRTPCLKVFLDFVGICARNHHRLWVCLGHRKRNRNRMATYIKKTSAMDNFLKSVKTIEKGKRTIVAYGAARFNCCSKGKPAVPTVAAYKMCRKHYPTYLVDEFKTSQICPCCDQQLIAPFYYDTITAEDGSQRKVRKETRGVRWCNSTKCLGSRGFDPSEVACVMYVRDYVGAKNIHRCFGKTNKERPLPLQRKAADE